MNYIYNCLIVYEDCTTDTRTEYMIHQYAIRVKGFVIVNNFI